jgi:hypothetical protein
MAVAIALVATTRCRAGEDFDDLLRRIPAQANMIVCCDVAALHNSKLGSSKAWQERRQQNYAGGLATIPGSLKRLVVAGHLDPSSLGTGWQIAVAQTRDNLTTEKLAQIESGTLDQIDNKDIVLGPRNAFYVVLDSQVVGMRRPANRQETARWLRTIRSQEQPTVSRYLQVAASRITPKVQFVLGIDLTDVFDPAGLKRKLANSQAMSSSKADIPGLAKLISGMQGLMLTIGADETMTGELRLDFTGDVRPYAQYLKQLILESLDNMGAHLEEITEWSSAQTANTYTLRGNVTQDMAHLLVTAIVRPSAVIRSQPVTPAGSIDTNADPKAVATATYYRHLREQLDLLKNCKARSFKQLGLWYWKGAEQIDDLPILNVDPELQNLEMQISATLKGMSNLAQQTNSYNRAAEMNAVTQLTTVPVNYSGAHFGPYGGAGYSYTVPGLAVADNTGTISNMIARNSATEGALRTDTWKNIDTAMSMMRQKLTSKYNMEFR